MPQTLGATGTLRNDAEALLDQWLAATADHDVCATEQQQITDALRAIVAATAYVDDTLKTGLSWLKNGLDAQITQRRAVDHERLYGAISTDAPAVVVLPLPVPPRSRRAG